jgi:hypothetical protein
MLQPGQELSPEEVVAMKRDEETTRLSTLLATPMGKAMFSDGPEYTPEEVVTMQAAEAQAEIPAEQVLVAQVLELNDPNAPDQSKDEWRRRTQLKKTLQEQGLLDSDFMATAKGVGGLVMTIADGATSPLRYDPRDESGNVIPAKDGLEYVSRYNPLMWPASVSDALNRSPATLNYAGELLEQGYGIMNDGLAGMGGPRYKVKETGAFITEMDRAMYRTKVAQTGGLAGDPSDDALIKQYAAQGMTLEPVTPEDVEEFEYQQHLRFRGRLKSIEQKRTEGAGPEVVTSSLMTAGAAPLDWLTGSNYMDQVWGKKLPAESQAMVMQMGADPLMWTSFGAGLTRLGVSTAAKGGGARILDAIGKGAQKMARPTEQSLREVQRFQNAVWSKGRVALYAGTLAGMNYSNLPEPLKNAMNVAAAAYVIHRGGAGTLRWVGDKFPQAAVMLREAADPLNGADIMARQAIAKNPKIPAGIRERVAKPSQFMAMESTPARLARNETLSPKTRKMMERLSNFYVVQGVRGASAVATGATKGAIVSAPFAELTRGGGDEEGANLIYGAGTALGGAGGAASRVFGARNRTVARAESDIGRMLVDIQGTVPELQRQGAVKRQQWFDRELNRFLTDVELAGGDIAHMFQARSFDEIARTAAMQGMFRNVDYVPLNDADFALNAKAHGQSGAAGFYLHNPDGARPRLFVNLDARRADVDAHEFGEAFFSSDAFSPEQKAAMRAEVDARYGPEGVTARAREYAEQMIKSENARNFPNETLLVSDDQIRAKIDELAQDELGRGGQDPADWARREIMVEEWRMAGTDYARLRRGVPAGANPVTFVENILGANARALGLSGVRIDPETGRAITPDQLFKENPVAADDPIVNRNLRAYIKTYSAWLNDPSQEVPSGVKVARDGNVQSLANNPNVDFYSSDPNSPTAPRENTFAVLGPDGRVVEKPPKQRRDERKARNTQVKNMAGRNLLAPGDPNFGLKRWADGRVRASGRRLPQSIILQNHWKPWLPIINTMESLADSGESMQVRYFAKGNSADKVKTSRYTDVDAVNREVVFDQWTTNADGDLLAQLLDMTTLRNRAMRAIGERNPALDPANGGPGYSLQAVMDDVNQWMADKRAGKAGEATIGPDRKNIVNALINPGTTLNRGKNPLAGSMGKGSAIKTLILEGINAVSGTGRKGAAMDYNWANGNFMPDQPPPRPDVDIDLPQDRIPQQIPREAQGMPDVAPRGQAMPDVDARHADLEQRYRGGNESALAEAQSLADTAAKDQGYRVGPVYHWTPDKEFNVFDLSKGREGHHFGTKQAAEDRSMYRDGRTIRAFLKGDRQPVKDMMTNDAVQLFRQLERDGLITRKVETDYRGATGGVYNETLIRAADGKWALENKERLKGTRRALSPEAERNHRKSVVEVEGKLGRPLRHPMQELQDMLGSEYTIFEYPNKAEDKGSMSYAVTRPEQIKSAEPFTYDDGGRLIPMSRRYDRTKPDVRFMPDAVEDMTTDQLQRQYEENQGYLGLSTLGMREGRPVRGGAAQTRELLRRNDAISAELLRRGVREEDPQLQRALQRRGQAMPDVAYLGLEQQSKSGDPAATEAAQIAVNRTARDAGLIKAWHGSQNLDQIEVFDKDRIGTKNDAGFYGRGFYFTFGDEKYSPGEAGYYGSKVGEFYLQAKNPFIFSDLATFQGERINFMGVDSLVFLKNIADRFPEIGKKITVDKVKWKNGEGEVTPINAVTLSRMIDNYNKRIKVETVEDSVRGNYKAGWTKKETVDYDHTSSGGSKGSFETTNLTGRVNPDLSDAETKMLLIAEFLEKEHGIKADYHPEGYMTRFPEITKAIRDKGHDAIMQGRNGDEIVVFEPEQIKSAAAFTYDKKGKPVPLSKRFNFSRPEISYGIAALAAGAAMSELDGQQ